MADSTPLSRAVESFLGSLLTSTIERVDDAEPCPPLREPLTIDGLALQVVELAQAGEAVRAARVALVLASLLGRQGGVDEKKALAFASLAWAQTKGLAIPAPKR